MVSTAYPPGANQAQPLVLELAVATHRSDARQERDGMDGFFFLGTEVGPAPRSRLDPV